MHFSIPDTEEIEDSTGSSYKVFNVHVNGVLHCSVRYSQLHDLNNQFRKELNLKTLPQFPPKKLLQLNDSNLKERRVQLEKYIQEVSQDPMLSNSDIFNAFLRRAQQETRREESIPVSLNIYLLNGSKVQLNISSTDQTDDVLENTIVTIGLPEDLTYYFGLYLVRSDNQPTVIRQLQDFECPYISLKSLKDRRLYKIVIRKSYWDQCYDEIYKTDRTALNLLHSQAENDVKVGWTGCSDAAKVQLTTFNKRGSKKEFLELCQTLQNYGYIQFKPCVSDFPEKNSRVIISAGNYEIKFKILMRGKQKQVKEAAFNVTRIKCWRILSMYDDSTNESDDPVLQFEYLVGKDNLQWITLQSEQAIMLSMCIKSMVDELLRKRKGDKIRKPSDRIQDKTKPTFKPRDKTTECLFDASEIQVLEREGASNVEKAKESVKKITEKLASVSILSKPVTTDGVNHSNDVTQSVASFEPIGDDDL